MSLTTRELKEVESKAAKLDVEIEVAIKTLEQRLQSNKTSNSLSCMPCPNYVGLLTPPACYLAESGILPQQGQKIWIFAL